MKVLEEEGLDSDGAIESTSKLRSQVLATSGVDILTDTGAYKSTYQILLEIAEVWDQITDDKARAGLLELLAGKRNSSVIAALLQNPEDLKAAYEDAMDAEGSALEENERYLDSIQGKIDQFNNAMQAMWSNTLDSDVVKDFVAFGTEIIKVIDKIGLLNSSLIALATYSMFKHKMGPIAFFKNLFEMGKQGISWAESHIRGLKNITLATDDLHKATTTLTQTQLKEKLTSQGLTDNVAEQIVAKTNLGKATDELSAKTLDATLREMGYNKEKRESILQTVFDTDATKENSQANKENAASNMAAGVAEDKETQDTKENIIVTKQDTQVTKENTQANKENAASNGKLGGTIKSLGGNLKQFAKDNAATLSMAAATLFTVILTKVVDGIVKTMDEMQEEFDESVSELDATNSELKTLESQLKEVNTQIDEINSNTPLSFTDQEELSRLEAQSSELQRQIDLAQTLKEQQAIGVNSNAIQMANAYKGVGVNSGKTVEENTGDAVKVAGGIGAAATGIAGTLAAVGAVNSWNVVGWVALIAAAVTAAAGGIAYAVSSSEEKVGDSLDNMKEQYAKIQEEYNTAREKYQADPSNKKNKKKFEEAQEAFNSYQSNMASYMSEMDSYYAQIRQNWDVATTDQKTAAIEWADQMDTWAIQTGGTNAKSNAIARIFGDEASEELAKIKGKIEEAVKSGEDFELKDILTEEEYQAVLKRISGVGVGIGDVTSYFEDEYRTEVEAMNDTSTESAVKEVANLTSGVQALKDAFNELRTEGKVSFDTLMDLKNVFGGLDSWSDFITTMSTGTATMEQMTEQAEILAEEFVSSKISPSGLINPDEYLTYINGLEALGITNAKEFFNAKLQEAAVGAFVNGTYKTIEEAEAAFSSDDYKLELSDDLINAAQAKKAADDAQKKAQNDASAYNAAVTALGNAQGAMDAAWNEWNNSGLAEKLTSKGHTLGNLYKEDGHYYEKTASGNILNWDGNADIRKYLDLKEAYGKAQQDYLTALRSVPLEPDTDDAAQKVSDTAKAYQAELDKIGLVLDIQLVDVNDLIDDLQGVYDTLTSAAKEYAENGGYVSVDTLQTLLGLEPKYIGLLYNEQGQLELNTESVQRMTQARIMEMAILQAKSYLTDLENAAMDGNVEKLTALTEATYIATEAEWGFVDSQLASIKTKMMDKGMSESEATDYINNARHNIESMKKLAETTAANISNTISSSGNTATAEANDAFQDAMDYWENRIGAKESQLEQVQNEIDMLEATGKKAGAGYFAEQLGLLAGDGGKLSLLNQQLGEAQVALAQVPEGSEDWWTIANTINDIHNEIDQTTMAVQDLKDAMADTHWYMFDEAHDRVSTLTSNLENIRDILSNEELFDDEGNFTKEGLGTLATYVQELGVFEGALANAKAEMELFGDSYDPNKTYVDAYGNDLSIDSEQDWYDAAKKAEDQYDEWNSKVIETRYSIKDLYEQQIDSVEEYTQTLVENYNEYIDAVKEALDSERDLYEFKKSTEQKSKNIAAIERRIASLSGSTNAADVAERRKLQAELTDAKSDMDDHYYSHAKEQQSQALDNEMTAYETAMNTYIEGLRTKLEESTTALYMSYEEMSTETKSFVDGVTQGVVLNAGNVKNVYLATGETIDDCLMTPWTNAAAAVGKFSSSEGALGLMNSWTEAKVGAPFYDFQTKVSGYLSKPWSSIVGAGGPVQTFKSSVTSVMSQIVSSVNTNVSGISGYISGLKTEIDKIKDTTIRITTVYENGGGGGGEEPQKKYHTTATLDIGTATLHSKGTGSSEADAKANALEAMSGNYYNYKIKHGANEEAIYSLWTQSKKKVKYDTKYYAKGTTGTTRDEWAITDEPQFGDELILVPGKDGNLSFMRKGTGVVPADMTQKLFELAQIPTSDLMNKNLTAIVPNITKNDFKNEFNFESLVHVDTVDSDTLPKLEKMVDKKIDDFSKALNYSLKRFAR